ncbi:4664_t:CDS:2 [Diversispora eburnea]|uniref:4664_t:CDS:1 n=1 Tax=Diversispora eburnea TaxID=1213867 RepID=A0A9N9AGS4_9GLOM|nr:4664_t:CDS:2 [Diversispora eburnea]
MSKEQIKYLKSLKAIRERSKKVYQKAESNSLNHFQVDLSKLQNSVDVINKLMKRDYESIKDIPPHGRWRHFDVGGKPRVQHLIEKKWKKEQGCETREITRRLLDLFVVSVLLDAGAGSAWSYKEPGTGEIYNRSEGLAIASLDMFISGIFSSSTSQPYQVDADKLINISVNDVRLAFQVNENNPLEGLEGRANLLSRLGYALKNHLEFFKRNLLDYILSQSTIDQDKKNIVNINTLWSVIIDGLSEVWPPTRTTLNGVSLGDVWSCELLVETKTNTTVVDEAIDPTSHFIPFHKLSQWLAYSLIEPLSKVSEINFEGIENLTGLPEYRNGGLFVDTGVLTLKENDYDRVIIEWRSMTLILLDIVAERIRDSLGLSPEQLSLAQVLEAGTWKAGREIAATKRPISKGPPIAIKSDGTVF